MTRTVPFGNSAAVCSPWLTGIGLRSPSTNTAGTVTDFSRPAKPFARLSSTDSLVWPLLASARRSDGG